MFLLLVFSSICLAKDSPFTTNVEWTQISDTWYYAPAYTSLNPQGRLEVWTKMVKGNEITISHIFVNPNFDMYMTVEWKNYNSNGVLMQTFTDRKWSELAPGSYFEQCLQAASNSVKNK